MRAWGSHKGTWGGSQELDYMKGCPSLEKRRSGKTVSQEQPWGMGSIAPVVLCICVIESTHVTTHLHAGFSMSCLGLSDS